MESPDQENLNAKTIIYAGFWLRFLAYIIDSIILGCALTPFFFIFFHDQIKEMNAANDPEKLSTLFRSVLPTILGIQWIYFAAMESSKKQATPGKRALGIIVTDMDGDRVTFGKATIRFFGKILSSLILYIGYIMIGFTEKKQALHDKLAETLVIRK